VHCALRTNKVTSHANPVPIRLLCVEDNPDDTELLSLALERADPRRQYVLRRVEDARRFVEALEDPVDVVLCDFNLPRFSPYAALHLLAERRCNMPLVVVTRAIGEDAAVNVLRCGAKDYVTKDKLGTLPQVIGRVMNDRRRVAEQERMSRELEAAYERVKELSARLIVAQERERRVISRELHDHLGQTLTGVVIHLHAAGCAVDPKTARQHTETASAMAQEAIQQVRTLSFSLRPAQLDLLGMTAAVQTAVQRLAEPAGLAFKVSVRGAEPKIPGANASVALRLLQEGLTNALRHANASRVDVRLRYLPQGRIAVMLMDDGIGFDKHRLLNGPPSELNVGLYGMMERTELAGGRLHIRTRPGRGVVLRAVL
jgi:signal transduction histidine kinase